MQTAKISSKNDVVKLKILNCSLKSSTQKLCRKLLTMQKQQKSQWHLNRKKKNQIQFLRRILGERTAMPGLAVAEGIAGCVEYFDYFH